jgi:hypothetical protein
MSVNCTARRAALSGNFPTSTCTSGPSCFYGSSALRLRADALYSVPTGLPFLQARSGHLSSGFTYQQQIFFKKIALKIQNYSKGPVSKNTKITFYPSFNGQQGPSGRFNMWLRFFFFASATEEDPFTILKISLYFATLPTP